MDAQDDLMIAPKISGIIFHDKNKDGIKDEFEEGIGNIQVLLLPDSTVQLTDRNGAYSFLTTHQDSQTIKMVDLPTKWRTDRINYLFVIDENGSNETYNFPLNAVEQVKQLTSSTPICDEQVSFWLSTQNINSRTISGELRMVFPNLVSPVESNSELNWQFANL